MKVLPLNQKIADMLEDNQRQRYVLRRRAERRRDMDHIAEHLELPTRDQRGGGNGHSMRPGNRSSSRRSMASNLLGALAWAVLFAALIVVIWLGRNGIWGS